MVKIFSMTERVDETGKRENGRSHVKRRKGTRLQTIEENGGISQIEILNRGD
jgi:hypothetical protein